MNEKTNREKIKKDYKFIFERIIQTEKKYKCILFAGSDVAVLPVTIPVNVAIQLAKEQRRCLLIDLDLKRNAVAKVFEIDGSEGQTDLHPRVVKTEIKNLWVWPAHNFTRLKQMSIKPIVQKAMAKFNFILINAPYLISNPDRKQIISAAQAAYIFSKNSSRANKLAELIKVFGCALIGNIQTGGQAGGS